MKKSMASLDEISATLVAIATSFHTRGWMLGTSGNLSAVVEREPLRLAITPSGADKGELFSAQILLIDDDCKILSEHGGKPSDESPLHVMIAKNFNAGAVLHTHSVWSTILSEEYFADGGMVIEGYEMLKGLRGVGTHLHREWVPIVDNSQDMQQLAQTINDVLTHSTNAHAVLLRRHGLYTWGQDLKEAKRHVEILEFLLEATGRRTAKQE